MHDRGTLFGLQTNARIESVLMSLPPLAAWEYAPVYEPGSFEAELMAMLEPRDWVAVGRVKPDPRHPEPWLRQGELRKGA